MAYVIHSSTSKYSVSSSTAKYSVHSSTSKYVVHLSTGSTSPAVVYDTDYQAVLDRATTLGYTLPSDSQKTKQNQLVTDLKAAGIWTLLDVFYVFATDGSSDFATINWKTPTANQITKVNSPTFTTNQGFNSNGTSSYLNTNWTPSTATNYQTSNALLGVWWHTVSNNTSGNAANAFGCHDGTRFTQLQDNNSSNLVTRLNQSNSGSVTWGSTGAFSSNSSCVIRRNVSGSWQGFIGGSQVANVSNTANGRPTTSMAVLAFNANGSIANFAVNTWKVSMFFAGSAGITIGTLHTYLDIYMSSL